MRRDHNKRGTGPTLRMAVVMFLICLFMPQLEAADKRPAESGRNPVGVELQVWALHLEVADLARAVTFYGQALGFEPEASSPKPAWALMKNGEARLFLSQAGPVPPINESPGAYLNFRVADIPLATHTASSAGASLNGASPKKISIGEARSLGDPFGHPFHLLAIDGDTLEAGKPPVVFNIGMLTEDLEAAQRFYSELGFEVFSHDYLPKTLPFKKKGAIPLVMHLPDEKADYFQFPRGTVLLVADNLKNVRTHLAARQAAVTQTSRWGGLEETSLTLRDPGGHLLRIVERAWLDGVLSDAEPLDRAGWTRPEREEPARN